jgi:Cu/Ag efflux protein CusF
MKYLAIFGLIILTTSIILGGSTNMVFAQDNPPILLKIATTAQNKIQSEISNNSSEDVKKLFEEGKQGVVALEIALSNGNLELAKKEFLSTMKIFTQISHLLTYNQTSYETPNQATQKEENTSSPVINPQSDLIRMQDYVNSLKTIAKIHNSTIVFLPLDELFVVAKTQINKNQYEQASNTIQDIKNTIIDFNAELRQQASQKELDRAQEFAQKYLKQLDRLIEHAKKIELSEDIIQKLEIAREGLTLAISPSDIIKEVRNIMLIHSQFELSESKLLELRIIQTEEKILEISESDQFTQHTIEGMNKNIQTIRDLKDKKEFEHATELLKASEMILEKIQI